MAERAGEGWGTGEGGVQGGGPADRGGGTLAVASGIFSSRLAGLLRTSALGAFFGVGPHADVFSAALRLPNLLPMVTVGAAYFVAAIVTFKLSFPATPLSGLVTGSAITSLVIGLPLQPILGNIFAGVLIGLEKPFRINDWITLGDIEDRVV